MGTFKSRRTLSFERLESRFALSADFSGNNVVDADDLQIWQDNYGTVNTAEQPQGDADDDRDVDGRDFLAWQRQFGNISLVAPRNVEARTVGPTSIEVTWDASLNAIDYLVARRQPDTETAFTIIAPNVVGTSYIDSSGLSTNTLYEYLVVAQRNPSSAPSQVAQAITNQSNLTAYRPQGVYDPDDTSTPNPIYDPFPKRPVREQDEFSASLGPGIRINRDDDNNNGVTDAFESGFSVTRENDLIEVKVDRLPGQGDLILQPTGALRLFYDHDLQTPIPLNGSQTEPLSFTGDTIKVFVEWNFEEHGTDILSLLDATTFSTLDSLRFHSFRSLIIAFGGDGQNPADTDGDGSIGDPVGDDGNREGLFDIAQFMYDTGWDVLAFDEEAEELGDDVPSTEIINAREQRFVERHAVIGYSHGGGATHDLIEDLYADHDIITDVGVFLDAVDQFGTNAENDWPDVVFYILNIYETNSFLNGAEIDENEVVPGAMPPENVNTTSDAGWDHSLDHFSIDDDLQVGNLIVTRLNQFLFFR